jgi:hypothetical protein
MPSTRAPFRKITRPPAASILASSSDLSGCNKCWEFFLLINQVKKSKKKDKRVSKSNHTQKKRELLKFSILLNLRKKQEFFLSIGKFDKMCEQIWQWTYR